MISDPDRRKQILEIGEHSVLVEVLDYKDPEVPALASVRERVLKAYTTEQAKVLAREKGEDLVKALNESGTPDIRVAAEAASLTVKSQAGLSREMGIAAPFGPQVLQQAVFTVNVPMIAPRTGYESAGKQYVIQVRSITPPDSAQIDPQVDQFVMRESQRAAQVLVESVSNLLKSQAEIDIHESVMAGS